VVDHAQGQAGFANQQETADDQAAEPRDAGQQGDG
jgi:hypothetical protein